MSRASNVIHKKSHTTSSSIQTVLSVLESHQILRDHARGLILSEKHFSSKAYRRSGISPCPEDLLLTCSIVTISLPPIAVKPLSYFRNFIVKTSKKHQIFLFFSVIFIVDFITLKCYAV